MIDLALDPSETRPGPARPRSVRRPRSRIALLGLLGFAATGAFASLANTYLSGLAAPQRAPVATRQKASDWPDLKDGLPALASGSAAAIPAVREILPPEPAQTTVVENRTEPANAAPAPDAARTRAKPLPALVDVPVIGPARQVALVAPARSVAGLAPLSTETVRARTAPATFAALPPENERTAPAQTAPEPAGLDPGRAKPRGEAHARPPAAAKPTTVKAAARKPAAVEAAAAPPEAPAPEEDAEVFGIKVPSLAPAGRKIREGVEALGDAVKGIPDRF